MNRCTRTCHRRNPDRHAQGFSLLEVLIAVVVLAIGLLALASLQGRLAQASADAKSRARVAAMLSARMDQLRLGGYGALASTNTTSIEGDGCDPASTDGAVFPVGGPESTYDGEQDFGSDDLLARYDAVLGSSWVVEGLVGLH